jgi:peptidoglycan/xylan/chitin deacetylase (PgdA/CDA1 family)
MMHEKQPVLPKNFLKFYYWARPVIPRRLQVAVRRWFAMRTKNRMQDSWPILKGSELAPDGWKGWMGGKQFAVVLTHDVDTQKGYDTHYQILKMEKELGFVSSFNFVPERYRYRMEDLERVKEEGFEVGVHGLKHDGKLFHSEEVFAKRALKINAYLRKWGSVGFRAPSMHHNLEMIKNLEIEYDASTFDIDPFEPQADGMHTIFPFPVFNHLEENRCFWELPYTLPQDFTIFILLKEKTIDIWQKKLDWIVENGGMALLNTHPDYMNFWGSHLGLGEFPARYYRDFLEYINTRYAGAFWNPLPRDLARFLNQQYLPDRDEKLTKTEQPGIRVNNDAKTDHTSYLQ